MARIRGAIARQKASIHLIEKRCQIQKVDIINSNIEEDFGSFESYFLKIKISVYHGVSRRLFRFNAVLFSFNLFLVQLMSYRPYPESALLPSSGVSHEDSGLDITNAVH